MVAYVTIHERQPAVRVQSAQQLDTVLSQADDEARARGMLNLVFIEAENGNNLSLVVGGRQSTAAFNYAHGDPPYLASKGLSDDDDPVLTCYGSLHHHTEFPRKWVIPIAAARLAAREFFELGALPTCIEWVEV